MEKAATRLGSLFRHQTVQLASIFIVTFSLLTGCASSNVSRDAASNVDMGINNAKRLGGGLMNGDMAESYQNASQATKGAVVGGTTGAAIGAFASTVAFVPGALVGGLLGMSYGSYIDSQSTLMDKLKNRGATVVKIGDQIMVVVNSARLFDGMTSKMKVQGRSTLDLVAQFINQFPQMSVKVAAYTDDIGSEKVNLALSKKQAQTVERYLSSNGLNTRVLYADGYGPTNLVQKNTDAWGKSDNYRIEITLQRLYV